MPWLVFEATKHALVCLSFEEIDERDRPPRRIWDDPEALHDHFARVKARRKREADPNYEAAPDGEPVENAAVKEFLRG